MTLSGKTILIADGRNLSAAYLRQRFIDNGAVVHVATTTAAAIRLAGIKRIDVAMLGFSLPDGHELKRSLEQQGISWVLCGTPSDATLLREAALMREAQSAA